MPILHCQFKAQGKGLDGKLIELPPPLGLQRQGPLVQVAISPQQAWAKALVDQGKQVPPPKVGFALLDTGASNTCIDDQLALDLQLPVIDVGFIGSASHAKTQCNIYPIQIQLVGFPILFQSPRTCGSTLKDKGVDLLLGRDLLARCAFFYNGFSGEITLSI